MAQRRSITLFVAVVSLFAFGAIAQDPPRPPVSPGVGRAVLIGLNSIQLDRDVVVISGDVIVNNAATTAILGEQELSLDRGASTPAGFRIAANGVDLDGGAVANGDVYYNTLANGGTISGALITPLALPVFANLPSELHRTSGSSNVTVAEGATVDLDSGDYAALVVGKNATARFTGGGYTFESISVQRGGALRFATASNVVVNGNVTLETDGMIAPATGASITGAAIEMQVHGASMTVGQDSAVFANVFVTAGSLLVGQDFEGNGAFFARDIKAARSSRFTLNSGLNLPPTGNAQNVFTNGATPVTITLTGSDPEGQALSFSIVSAPTAGTLSSVVSTSATSATVTYTPAGSGNVADSFTFRVTDPGGAFGDAVVRINPTSQEPPPPAPTTVVAEDGSATTSKDVAATLLLRGNAPEGVALTFSIVSGTGPFHGSLGSVVQGTESPQRTATVVYTPDAGYTGSDSFQFEACGTISATNVCDTATFSITVLDVRSEPPGDLVTDLEVSTPADTEVTISLFNSSSGQSALLLRPMAATLDPAEIAGNVADANNDGTGDNHMTLPSSVPVFMSAGVGLSGGAGSNGTVRMHFEWDITSFNGSIGNLQSATVELPTHRGTIDSLDTFFHVSASDGDGALTDSDFAITSEQVQGVVMPVPSTVDMPVGSDGTFSFSVFNELKTAVESGFDYFVLQGRVNESLSSGRGLEVRTSVTTNGSNVPSLGLTTPPISAPVTVRILSLPASGVLRDSNNTLISSVPFTLSTSQVKYTPNAGFTGDDEFQFDVNDGFVTDTAFTRITVTFINCATNVGGCDNGRE